MLIHLLASTHQTNLRSRTRQRRRVFASEEVWNMKETYVWNRKSVNRNVAKNSIGCYQLGNPDQNGNFVVGYIGRSLRCLNNRLSNNHPKRKLYTMFRFCQLESVREVFDTECRWFHLYSGEASTNLKHPDSPRMLGYQCKYCMRHKARSSDNKTKNRGEI